MFTGNKIDSSKIQDLVQSVVNCLCRFKDKLLIESLLSILDYISEIKGSAKIIFSPELNLRLLNFSKQNISPQISSTSLRLLNWFGSSGTANKNNSSQVEENLKGIVKNMERLLKDPDLP